MLVCLGTNPVYDAPSDLHFEKLLHSGEKKVKTTIHLGLHLDETGQHSDWHFPMAHELESWGDARAHNGTVSLQQPLVAPLHGGMTALEMLAFLSQQSGYEALAAARDTTFGCDLLRDHWKTASGNQADFDSWWRKALHEGVVATSEFAAEQVTLDAAGVNNAVLAFAKGNGFEIALRP